MPDLNRAIWRKSIRSGNGGNCVEIADNLSGVVAVRDSKNPEGPALVYTRDRWHSFLSDLKGGKFDL